MVGHPGGGRPAHQLPSGRHGIPHDLVLSNQRGRLLKALMEVVMRNGYASMRVADVIAIAGVSRRTFYDNFANKQDAFLAAYDAVVRQLMETVGAQFATGDAWPDKVARALTAFLTSMASGPAVARVCIVEVLAAGPSALERRATTMSSFRQFIVPDAAEVPAAPLVSELTIETIIGGLYEVVYARVIAGRTDELPLLVPDLLRTILLPFVGAEAAALECARVARSHAAAPLPPVGG